MKRHGFLGLILVSGMLLTIPGCDTGNLLPPTDPVKLQAWIAKNKPTIIDLVKMAAEFGTEKGLKEWAKKDLKGANEAALTLSKNISSQILPYFKDSSKLLTAKEVKQLLSSSLFKDVPDVVKVAIVSASAVLDYYCPIPDSDKYLTQDQRDIVCAFFEGVHDGCDDFTPPTSNVKEIKKGKKRSLPKNAWLD